MKKKYKIELFLSFGFLAAFVAWTLLLGFIDVRPIGPLGSSVGFATVNEFVHDLTGANMGLYVITDWLGLVPFAVAFGFAILGLVQMIKRRSFIKVDSSILVLGALENSEAYSVNLPPDMTGITDGYILRADDEIVGQSVLCSALNDYCGKNYKFLHGAEKEALLEKIQEETMGIWPAKDSVLVVNDVIIINLGSEVQ